MKGRRYLKYSFVTDFGGYDARVYDTGLLALSEPDAPPSKKSPSEPASRIRVLELGHEDKRTIELLADFLARVIPHLQNDSSVTVAYSPKLYKDVLSWVLKSDDDVLYRFAVLCSFVGDTRNLPLERALEVAEQNRHRMAAVVRYNAWQFFLREDLGLISANHFIKPKDAEDFEAQLISMKDFLQSRLGAHALARIEAGVETDLMTALRKGSELHKDTYLTSLFRSNCNIFLTNEEITTLGTHEKLVELSREYSLAGDFIVALGFTYAVTGSMDRALEVATTILGCQQNSVDNEGYFSSRMKLISVASAELSGEPINMDRLQEAVLKNDGLPFAFSYMVNSNYVAEGESPKTYGPRRFI